MKGLIVILGSTVCTMVVTRYLLKAMPLVAEGSVDWTWISTLGAEQHWHCHDQLVLHAGGLVC